MTFCYGHSSCAVSRTQMQRTNKVLVDLKKKKKAVRWFHSTVSTKRRSMNFWCNDTLKFSTCVYRAHGSPKQYGYTELKNKT